MRQPVVVIMLFLLRGLLHFGNFQIFEAGTSYFQILLVSTPKVSTMSLLLTLWSWIFATLLRLYMYLLVSKTRYLISKWTKIIGPIFWLVGHFFHSTKDRSQKIQKLKFSIGNQFMLGDCHFTFSEFSAFFFCAIKNSKRLTCYVIPPNRGSITLLVVEAHAMAMHELPVFFFCLSPTSRNLRNSSSNWSSLFSRKFPHFSFQSN